MQVKEHQFKGRVIAFNDRLQLRFSDGSKRYSLSLGLRYSSQPEGCRRQAKLIEAEIIYERLDPTFDQSIAFPISPDLMRLHASDW